MHSDPRIRMRARHTELATARVQAAAHPCRARSLGAAAFALFLHLGATLARVALAFVLAMTLGSAIGYLMGAHGLAATTAFNLLRKQARDSRRRVADVAAEVLGGSTGPDADQIRDRHSPGRALSEAT